MARTGRPAIDRTGQTFGLLTVLERVENPQHYLEGARWRVRCECGKEKVVLAKVLRRGDAQSCGCMWGRPRIDNPGYSAMHWRVKSARGRAAAHKCAHCDKKQAEQWAYDHGDPNELTAEVAGFGGRTFVVPYSLDPAHFLALCSSCHVKFDRWKAAV